METIRLDFTASPWDFDGAKFDAADEESKYHQIDATMILDRSPVTIADTSNRHYRIGMKEDQANARLISAAPDLAMALLALLGMHGVARDEQPALKALRKAGILAPERS